jgi:hypothetical protein
LLETADAEDPVDRVETAVPSQLLARLPYSMTERTSLSSAVPGDLVALACQGLKEAMVVMAETLTTWASSKPGYLG